MLTTTSATTLSDELRADGFRPGPPAHLRADCLMADLDSYSALECERCGHERHEVRPYHRGRAYRLLCVCRSCGNAVEM